MDDSRFEILLNERGVVVVHFSHFAVMGHKVAFPSDLFHAISSFDKEIRSCCALFPGHKMDLPGSVGIIFKPKYCHVLSVCSGDSGSTDYKGTEGSLGLPPEEDAILESLNMMNEGYNEWRVLGANPIGIFIANTQCIIVKQEKELSAGQVQFKDFVATSISLEDVKSEFKSWTIYTMGEDGLEAL